jgi:hypothetical protein
MLALLAISALVNVAIASGRGSYVGGALLIGLLALLLMGPQFIIERPFVLTGMARADLYFFVPIADSLALAPYRQMCGPNVLHVGSLGKTLAEYRLRTRAALGDIYIVDCNGRAVRFRRAATWVDRLSE